MSTTAPGSEPLKTSIAPWLSVGRATQAVDYYKVAFGATELYRMEDDAGTVQVAHLAIGEADLWVQQDDGAPGPESRDRRPIRMILTVDDPDSAFAQAVAAGATVVADVYEGHGWRVGRLADPFGHHWEIGKPLR